MPGLDPGIQERQQDRSRFLTPLARLLDCRVADYVRPGNDIDFWWSTYRCNIFAASSANFFAPSPLPF
jgi:hypothetical protein